MDFGALLCNAQKNKDVKKEPIRYYSTKFSPPRKEQKDKSRLSVNVRKFLEKKEEEERQKRLEAQKKKEELLALRSKDKKAVKRVNVMLKRTKSANQSAIQDAVDSDNTAVTLVGPAQPDEDDYGYVSQEASAFYSKMMEKYNKMPEEPPKFLVDKKKVNTNLSSTKDRVKAALEKEKEEAMMPHRRRRKHHNAEEESSPSEDKKDSTAVIEKQEVKKIKIEKPKPKMPPPMNFNDLLKLAEKKQFEPIVIEKKTKEDETPLTKKQRREMERVREWQERKKEKVKPETEPTKKITEINKPKLTKTVPQSKLEAALTKVPSKKEVQEKPEPEPRKKIDWGPKHPSAGKINISGDIKKVSSGSNSSTSSKQVATSSSKSSEKMVSKTNNVDSRSNVQFKDVRNNNKEVSSKKPEEPRNKIQKDITKPKQFPPNDLRPKQFPPNDLRPKQFPPNDLRPKQFPPSDMRRKPVSNKLQIKKRRILDEDDEEYDSELDDFIDDGPEEEEDYSKYIQEIFGYNKSKYAAANDCDDDDDIMESSYSQQMKEEQISTKYGIMEDLEEMRLEEEHKKRKALMKKKMQRR